MISGHAIASCLNITAIEVDRLGYMKSKDMPEVETWGLGNEIISIKEQLAVTPRCLLVGLMGDTIWERELTTISDDLRWEQRSHFNLTEMRLKTNFILIPAAFIGARKIKQINKISRSEDVKRWTLFTDYDRPICRRTVEEAGVPRTLFGQKKRATAVYHVEEGLRKTMTKESYESYVKFIEPNKSILSTKTRLTNLLWNLRQLNARIRRKANALAIRWTGAHFFIPMIFPETMRVGRDAFLFQWSINILQEKYRNAVKAGDKDLELSEASF